MGIKGFTTWLRTKFPVSFTSITKTPCVFDEVYIDLNSYLYKSAGHSSTSKQVLRQLEIKLLHTLRSIRARKRIFISIDGVAPAAKLDVQRSRRVTKSNESVKSQLFDAQNFTPGCLFMGKVEETLKKIGEKYSSAKGPDFEFIISGSSVKEEGEIKIAREIALQHHNVGHLKRVARAVLTVDSDAFLQAFVHEIPSLFILNAQDLKHGIGCFSGEVMREEVKRLLPEVPDTRQVQLDFALLSIFSGNDCVPSMPFGNITHLWPGYLEYVQASGGKYTGLVNPITLLISAQGLCEFARFIVSSRLDASMKKVYDRHVAGRPAKMTNDAIVDYLKSAQWSFARLLGSPVAQTLSLFLSPYPPTFYELAEMDVEGVDKCFNEACMSTKDNKLDKRKIPGAAAIMMLDPNSEKSISYIAKPLREIFTSFHKEDSQLDDHSRFKKLCQTIAEIPKELFTEDELRVTFASLPTIYSKRKHMWKPYDPAPIKKVDEDTAVNTTDPCPLLTTLYASKVANATH